MLHQVTTFQIIRKRDGRLTQFDKTKITMAIFRALNAVGKAELSVAETITDRAVEELERMLNGTVPQVEEIQDVVERILMKEGYEETAKSYILYRAKRTAIRDGKSELMDGVEDILKETTREQLAFQHSPSAKMLKIASAASRNFYLTRLIPAQYSDAHRRGDIHIHDLDFYGTTAASVHIPLGRLLQTGFSTGYGHIRSPKRIETAAALAAIILQATQNDAFGPQSFPRFDRDLGAFWKDAEGTDGVVFQAMEGLVYNLNTMYSRVGAQVPLSTFSVGLDTTLQGRAITRGLLGAMERGLGRGETPLFPQIIFQIREGVSANPADPNYDLLQQAIHVASKRLNPMFAFLDTPFNAELGEEAAYFGDGSRVAGNQHGDPTATGRGPITLVTLNLPRIALKVVHKRKTFPLSSFYAELDRAVNLATKSLLHRYGILSNLKVRELPFLMGEGVYQESDQLDPDQQIRPALRHGTLAIGLTGLAEALILLTKHHHGESEDARSLGLEIVDHLARRVQEQAAKHQVNLVLSAPPAEAMCGRFTSLDRFEFGVKPRVTNKGYYTTGVALPADFECTLEEKLAIEGPYHRLLNGGHFSFVELGADHGPEAVSAAIQAMRAHGVGLGGVSFPLDECVCCGSQDIDDGQCRACAAKAVRALRRSSIFLLPIERVNIAKKEEIANRKPQIR